MQNNSQVALAVLNKPKFAVVQKDQIEEFVQSLVLGFDPTMTSSAIK